MSGATTALSGPHCHGLVSLVRVEPADADAAVPQPWTATLDEIEEVLRGGLRQLVRRTIEDYERQHGIRTKRAT